MNPLQKVLLRPYPLITRRSQKVQQALLFGLFVFLFLYLLQPFQLGALQEKLLPIALGYGAVTTALMLLLNVFLMHFWTSFVQEKSWNAGKEAFWTLLNLFCITGGNLLYSAALKLVPLNPSSLLVFLFYTLAVGFFPTIVAILIQELRMRKRFEHQAEVLNQDIHRSEAEGSNPMQVLIPAENPKHNLSADTDAILLISSAENYVEVYLLQQEKIQKHLIRNTLTAVATRLEAQSSVFFRCHKSHLVHVGHVLKVSGNAQGYKLHIQNIPEPVPVSRQYNKTLHTYLSAHRDRK
jgi:hypothetical protein